MYAKNGVLVPIDSVEVEVIFRFLTMYDVVIVAYYSTYIVFFAVPWGGQVVCFY